MKIEKKSTTTYEYTLTLDQKTYQGLYDLLQELNMYDEINDELDFWQGDLRGLLEAMGATE